MAGLENAGDKYKFVLEIISCTTDTDKRSKVTKSAISLSQSHKVCSPQGKRCFHSFHTLATHSFLLIGLGLASLHQIYGLMLS